ncbi:MAG: peptide deformylase [bacterium]
MGVRKILVYGDETLRKESKEVHKVSAKIKALIKDLKDTMYAANGVGLAAPQIGENVRVFVVDVSPEDQPHNPIVFVNPKIIQKSGAINSYEGCLSFPEAYTNVRRYEYVKIKAYDINGRPFLLEAFDGTLLARAIQHEFDHLDGVLFIDHSRNRFEADIELLDKNLLPINPDKLINEPELEEAIAAKVEVQE